MKWLAGLYLASVLYAYVAAPRIEFDQRNLLSAGKAPVFEGHLMRLPASDLDRSLIHFDDHGLIVQADGDGGDTAQRTGMLFFRFRDAEAFRLALDQLEIREGIYVRHPYQNGFRNDPNRFSRDQQRAIVIALGSYGMTDRLWNLAKAHLLRFGKYQNLDYLGPSHLGEYIRAFRAWPLYPILCFTDLGLVISSVDIALTDRAKPDQVDDNNHVMALLQAKDVLPTPVSWIARHIYKSFRPENFGNSVLGEVDPAQGALAWYHRAESGGNPFIAELYRGAL